MTPTLGRSSRSRGSSPSTRTAPASGRRKPSQISTVVVLPAPFGPSRASTEAVRAWKDSPSTALRAPYVLTSPSTSRAGASMEFSLRSRPATGVARQTDPGFDSDIDIRDNVVVKSVEAPTSDVRTRDRVRALLLELGPSTAATLG